MRAAHIVLIVLAIAGIGCQGEARLETVAAGTALTGVNVVDVESGAILPDMTVVIDGDRITHVAGSDSVRLSSDVTQIPLPGTYVVPGLWDMHGHTYSDAEARGAFLPAFIAHGVTGIRDMFADCHAVCAGTDSRATTKIADVRHPSAGMGRAWDDDIAAGRLVGPRIVRSSYSITSSAETAWPSSRVVDGVADAREAVLLAAGRGVDFVKVYHDLGREEFLEIARVADSLSLPLAGHAPFALTPEEISDAGMDSFEHMLRLNRYCVGESGAAASLADSFPSAIEQATAFCSETFSRLAANRTHLVPTLIVLRNMGDLRNLGAASDPRRRLLPRDLLGLWDSAASDDELTDAALASNTTMHRIAAALVVAAHAAGVPVLAGSDVPNPHVYPGSGLHDELVELVRAGFTPLDALRSATITPARFLKRDDELGTVSAGKLADLVVLSANPIDDIGRIRDIQVVVANGRVYARDDLDRLMAAIEDFSRTF
jgi:imidazolonepropionase-like amidohydrolase